MANVELSPEKLKMLSAVALKAALENVVEEVHFQFKEKELRNLPLLPVLDPAQEDAAFGLAVQALAEKAKKLNDDGKSSWVSVIIECLGDVLISKNHEKRIQSLSQTAAGAMAAMENIYRDGYLSR